MPVVVEAGGRAERRVFRVVLGCVVAESRSAPRSPIETASAPSASALATSAPDRIPPETISWTLRCMSSSCSASTACGIAASVGIPTCSMNTSWVAAVPPCMPSRTTDVCARLDGEGHVVVGARRADLDEDRLLPVGDLAQFLDLDLEVIRTGPVGVATGAALIDALRAGRASPATRSEIFWPSSMPPPPGLAPWPDHDLDRVRATQIVGVHAVARREQLVDQLLGMTALLRGHASVASRGAGADRSRSATESLLGVAPRARRSSCPRS